MHKFALISPKSWNAKREIFYGRKYVMAADSEALRDEWVNALNQQILRLAQQSAAAVSIQSRMRGIVARKSTLQRRSEVDAGIGARH